jgi:adenine/guanine phosphoribosyltransferase-like PRPP-binding protein
MTNNDDLKALIRSIPDYPRPGIMFRDITTLVRDARMAFLNLCGVWQRSPPTHCRA